MIAQCFREIACHISDTCWEMVEQGELIAFDTRDQVKGGLFFDVKSGG